ncbi:hypothetical protein H0H92_002449 [Tricholoma furcatifolium]|nr:hypothetical protein H0H92_002449 [Tricholoma furcatifolium]
MAAKIPASTAEAFLSIAESDKELLHYYSTGQKTLLLPHLRIAAWMATIPEKHWDDDQLYRFFCTWCGKMECPPALQEARTSLRRQREARRNAKKDFIATSGMYVGKAARNLCIASMPVFTVQELRTPYPPWFRVMAETKKISSDHRSKFYYTPQPDPPLHRQKIHNVVESKLKYDILPNKEALFCTASGELIAGVFRNLCQSEEAREWVDGVITSQLPYRRNVRMEDTGQLSQMGWSAGPRSKTAFHWVHNLTRKLEPEEISAANYEASCVFTFAWQLMVARLPPEVVKDINHFVNCEEGWQGAAPRRPGRTKYTVTISNETYEFHDAELTPPGGVMGKNYSRAVHNEVQPHKWAISWTTSRTSGFPNGGHFYIAKYGIRIRQAPNTMIIWRPEDSHGTSAPAVHPSDPNPPFLQRGLAFVTSNRLATV